MDALEVVHVAGADLQEIVEIAGHQMAVEHAFQFRDRLLEGRQSFPGVERSSTTPTMTSVPMPTLRGATMAPDAWR